MRKTDLCGDIDSAIEQGRYELSSLPNSIFSKDKDTKRDREVSHALDRLNYERVRGEISEVVEHVLDVVHGNPRFIKMLSMPHYAKIKEDVLREIYEKYYS